MKVQFAARIASDVTERKVSKKDNSAEFTAVDFSVAEAGKDGIFHDVTTIPPAGLIPYLTKGKLIEISGEMSYTTGKDKETDKSHRYYKVTVDNIQLLGKKED